MAYFNKLERQTVLIKHIMLMLLSMKIQCGNKITKKLKCKLICKFLKKLSHKRYFPALLVSCGPQFFFDTR